MKVPKLLLALIVLLILSGAVSFCLKILTGCGLIADIANLALVLTLAALLVYVYCTYMIAVEAWTISASFALLQLEPDPYHFAFILQNHSKHSLRCWCKLNATVYGTPISLDRFYGGESFCDLQPFGVGSGHFDVRQILGKANRSVDEMKRKFDSANPKEQLYLNIEFWYSPIGRDDEVKKNPPQPHYFNFQKDRLVADF
jgi:hypothetical protein